MKILNIHGYNGSPDNSAKTALEALGHTVVSPSINYDSESPESIIEKLSSVLCDNSPDIIVGTSLGGFFAAVLSARNDLPVILVNPCLMPFVTLKNLGYKGDVKKFVPLFWELSALKPYNTSTIVGGKDEIINHEITKALLDNERFDVFPDGKHSGATLPLKEFFSKTIDFLGN